MDQNYNVDEEFFKSYEDKINVQKQQSENENDAEDFFRSFDMSREEVLEEVKKNGMFLRYASRFDGDAEIIIEATKNNANAFAYASLNLRTNKDIVQLIIDEKQVDIKEAQIKKHDELINAIQKEIQIINEIHEKALEEKERKHSGLIQKMHI